MNSGQIVWYVALDGHARKPQALRVLGEVSVPRGQAWLAERINGNMFNASKLLLLSQRSTNAGDPHDPELVPVRTYDGSRLNVGESVPEQLIRTLVVLDVAGIAPSREVAEHWSRK